MHPVDFAQFEGRIGNLSYSEAVAPAGKPKSVPGFQHFNHATHGLSIGATSHEPPSLVADPAAAG